MNTSESDYVIMKQPVDAWARDAGWADYDSSIQIFTLNPGIICNEQGCLLAELLGAFRSGHPHSGFIIEDKWALGLHKEIGGARQIVKNGASYLFIQDPALDEISSLFRQHWNDIGFVFTVRSQLESERSVDALITAYETERCGQFLENSIAHLLTTGHDNNFIFLATKSEFTALQAQIKSMCEKYGKTLKIITGARRG